MIVCVCKGVSDREIARAVEEGASTVKAVAKCTRAGTSCGCCHDSIRRVIDRTQPAESSCRLLPLLAATAG